ncbi:MAG: tetratricopeptide repeat protein, partial [Bacteroidales bacterium]|nr:tetratricopeptide repeat protein [Bacteroidales bacterium]
MKKIIISIFLFFPICLFAQSIDDIGKIILGVNISKSSTAETQSLSDQLKNKLAQIATQSGYSAFGTNNLFVISPNVVVNSTDMAEGGMKNIYVVKGELFLSIQERDNNVVYSSIAIPFSGSATSKDRAIKNAIVDIDFKAVEPCFSTAKEKILSYYENKQDVIFARANTYLANNQFDEAITCLMTVPEELSALYKKSLTRANEIYKLKQEEEQRRLKAEIAQYNSAI